jgi:hypothetical protein
MTEVQFAPFVEGEGYVEIYGVNAFWDSKCIWRRGLRFVFETECWLGKSSGFYFRDSNDENSWAEMKHFADTLNRWIPHHSEKELNTLVRLLPHAAGARRNGDYKVKPLPSTDAEKAILAEYRLLEQEGS